MPSSLIRHPLLPVYDHRSRVLLLGTMPSPRSRFEGFYYAHPQNRFWRVMGDLFGEDIAPTPQARRDFCLAHGIALWDVLSQCEIAGAQDASIREPVANDLSPLFAAAPIDAVFCTGGKAAALYRRLIEPQGFPAAHPLPSTSAANAQCHYDALLEAYRVLLPHLQH